jgi:hypothetical protein
MEYMLITLLILALGALVAFWENLMAWLKGQSYREYLDAQIEKLRAVEQKPTKPVPAWVPWLGLALAAIGLLFAEPGGSLYWVSLATGTLGLIGNGIVLTRKRSHQP